MPLPLAPIAGIALRYGAVALATYAIARRVERGHYDQRSEDAMKDVQEGLTLRRDEDAVRSTGRFRRVIRFGKDGPGVEIDAATLNRIRIRRLR
jgi:hypothetical protein